MNSSLYGFFYCLMKAAVTMFYILYALVAFSLLSLIAALVLLVLNEWCWAAISVGISIAPWALLFGWVMLIEFWDSYRTRILLGKAE